MVYYKCKKDGDLTAEMKGRSIMTNREFFNAVANADVSAELKEFAEQAIAKLDTRNEKRSSKPSKTAIENEPIKTAILELLAGGAKVASEIGVALGISTNKASALARQLTLEGNLKVVDIKVKGKGTVKSYSLADGE